LALGYYPKINFAAFILCEVMIMPRKFGLAAKDFLSGGAEKRRDMWPSKEEAYNILKARGIWKTWDDRALRSYVVCVFVVDNRYSGRAGLILRSVGIWDA
jgi:hypothetical protein